MRRRQRFDMWRSHLIVQVKGPKLEEFINECIGRGYHLWDTRRASTGMLIVRMHAHTFRQIRSLERRTQWEIRIVERVGAGFLFDRLFRRRPLVVGSIIAWMVWYVLSSYVWFIGVEGTDRVAPAAVLSVAREAGLVQGASKASIDSDHVQRALLLGVEDLVWAGLELRGTRALIQVAERRLPDEITQGPGHIVAARDGVIERVSAMQGTAVVEPGDTVRTGQILISGLLEPGSPEFQSQVAAGEIPYERAGGSVRALVWHEAVTEIAIGNDNPDRIKEQGIEVATGVARTLLQDEKAESIGDPVVEIEEDFESGIIRVRVLIQAVQDIGVFQAVMP